MRNRHYISDIVFERDETGQVALTESLKKRLTEEVADRYDIAVIYKSPAIEGVMLCDVEDFIEGLIRGCKTACVVEEGGPMPIHFQGLVDRIRSLDFEENFFCVTSGKVDEEEDAVFCVLHDMKRNRPRYGIEIVDN